MRRLLSSFVFTLTLTLLTSDVWAGMPTFVANGASTVDIATGTCTPTMPGSILADDILLAVGCGEGNDDGLGIPLTTANGFVSVTVSENGSDGDVTEEDPESNCRVYWKRAVGGDSAPVFTDSGNHTTCAVHQFRGVRTTGDPWNVVASGNDSNANDTSALIPGATTTTVDCLVVLVQATSFNGTSTVQCGAVTNADLATITERFDSTNTGGLGGGHCVITGEKASAGSYADSTLTLANTSFKAAYSIALEGAVATGCGTTIPLTGAGCK